MYQPIFIENPKIMNKTFEDIENLDSFEKKCIAVVVEGEEYIICEESSYGNNCWANSKKSNYGKGLGRTEEDKYKPTRTGALGQMAFGKLINKSFDNEYKKFGDQQDYLIGKWKIDVKCAMREKGEVLIYHTSDNGKIILLDKDIYVASYVDYENREEKKSKIVFVGYALKKDIENCKVQKGRKKVSKHLNYVLSFKSLRSINNLIKVIKGYA